MSKNIIIALSLFLLDVLLFNYLIAIVAVIVVIVACIFVTIKYIRVHIAKQGVVLTKNQYIKGGIYIFMIVSMFIANGINNSVAKSRANMLIENCEEYKQKHGEYPSELSKLIPEFIDAVPSPKYFGVQNKFHYSSRKESHILFYIVIPPFGSRSYNFENHTWKFIG